MARLLYSSHPRTTAERGECGDFVRRLLAREALPNPFVLRIRNDIVPVLDGFDGARSANRRTGLRAIELGKAFRLSSTALRLAIEAWMRSIDDAQNDDGYAEANLRGLFGDQPVSALFRRAARVRIETVDDLLRAVGEAPRLHGDVPKLAKVKEAFAVSDAALNAYDGIVEDRKGTVAALKVAAAAFDLEYVNFADRLLKDEQIGPIVPKFARGRKVVDLELVVQPDPEVAADAADAADTTDAAPAPDAVDPEPPSDPSVETSPIPE